MLAEQNRSYPVTYHVNYVAPGAASHNVELTRCGDYVIFPTSSFLIQTDDPGFQTGDPCEITPTFDEFCEATVRCRFTQTEYRDAVRDVCSADYDQGQLLFNFICFPGKQPLVSLHFCICNSCIHD